MSAINRAQSTFSSAQSPLETKQKAPIFFSDKLKEFSEEVSVEFQKKWKQMQTRTYAIKNPLWALKALYNGCQSLLHPKSQDPLQSHKLILEQAIKANDHQELTALLEKLEFKRLLNLPLPNHQLPLNFAVLIGNVKMVEKLLAMGCDPKKVDFQFQSALHLVYALENAQLKGCFKRFLEEKEKLRLEQAIPKGQVLDKQKLANALKVINEQLDEMKIIDPLAVSFNEKIVFIAGLALIMLQWVEWNVGVGAWIFKSQDVASVALTLGAYCEMHNVFNGTGQFHHPLTMIMLLSQSMPSVRNLYGTLKTCLVSLSLLHSLKISKDNVRFRPWAVMKKLTIDSFNFYHFVSHTFAIKVPKAQIDAAHLKSQKQMSQPDLNLCRDLNELRSKFEFSGHAFEVIDRAYKTILCA